MTEKFLNLMKERDTQVQEVQSPKQDEPKGPTARNIIVKEKKLRDKETIFKSTREKHLVKY